MLSQSDIDKVAAAVVARLAALSVSIPREPAVAAPDDPEAVKPDSGLTLEVAKKGSNSYRTWLTCVLGDMSGARDLISQEIADKVVAEADPKRTALFSGKALSDLDSRAWRALGVFAWKYTTPEARAAFLAAQAADQLAF
jgi:hypothetical protein